MTKAEAILQAIRETDVGSDIILHNYDMTEQDDDGGFIMPKGEL